MTKRERVDALKERLLSDDKFLVDSLVILYKQQTESERSSGRSLYSNGVGFNSIDSKILTSIAEYYIKKHYISPKQKGLVRGRITKYSGQLLHHEEGN